MPRSAASTTTATDIKILTIGDRRLRQVAQPVNDVAAEDVRRATSLAHQTLADFRQRHGFGRAIAAPQIGADFRFIAVHLRNQSFTLYNPEITWRSRKTFALWDDCMSFPNLLVRVNRHMSISVSYVDEHGAPQNLSKLDANEAELLQHEIDHLDGVLAVDRAAGPESLLTRSALLECADYYRAQVR